MSQGRYIAFWRYNHITKYGSHTAQFYSYSLSVCQIWWRSGIIERHFWRVLRLTCIRPIPIFRYFISRLLVDISICNTGHLHGCSQLNSPKTNYLHMSKFKVTGTVHCFLKVQSYHKNTCWHLLLLVCLSNEAMKTWASREITSQKNTSIFGV